MSKQNEISSTEKLLDLIKKKNPIPPFGSQFMADSSSRFAFNLKQRLAFGKKSISIGVDISHSHIKLVKIIFLLNNQYELIDSLDIPFQSQLENNSQDISDILKSNLNNFCNGDNKPDIWCTISSAKVETRLLRIPKVPLKQVSKAVIWAFNKEASYNEQEDILDFEILDESFEDGVPKINVMAFTAPKEDTNKLNNLFISAGYPLTGISIVPFAIQNLLRAKVIQPDSEEICNLFIGRDWSRITIYSKNNLVLSRDIKAGLQSMIESICESFDQNIISSKPTLSAQETPGLKNASEKFQNFIDNYDKISAGLSEKTDNAQRIFELIKPALQRLVRQVERTLEHYALHLKLKKIKKIFISGQITGNKLIIEYIGSQLGLPIYIMNPFQTNSTLISKIDIPDTAKKQESFVPAIGIGIARNFLTPNFIFTFKDRKKAANLRRFLNIIMSTFVLFLFIMLGTCLWQNNLAAQKRTEINMLKQQLEIYSPIVDQNSILRVFTQMERARINLKETAKKYIGPAVLKEVTSLTPSRIRLLDININMGNQTDKKKSAKAQLELEGLVFGKRLDFEAKLAGYLLDLKQSKLFSNPQIKRKTLEYYDDNEVLHFITHIKIDS